MGQAYEDFRQAGGDIVAVFQYRAQPTRNFCRKREVPFDCLGDPEREGYHAVGLEQGKPLEYLGPAVAKNWLRAAKQGAFTGIPKGDVSQRPGTFVVSSDGKVLFAHYNKDSTDNPPTETVLEAVRNAKTAA